MSLQESGEMYLETILILSRKHDMVRSIDISEYMGYSKPSVSRAVGILKKEGYITVEESGQLRLTPSGLSVAQKTYERHTVLTALFESIGVSPKTAAEDACKIEHVISDETFDAVKRAINRQ